MNKGSWTFWLKFAYIRQNVLGFRHQVSTYMWISFDSAVTLYMHEIFSHIVFPFSVKLSRSCQCCQYGIAIILPFFLITSVFHTLALPLLDSVCCSGYVVKIWPWLCSLWTKSWCFYCDAAANQDCPLNLLPRLPPQFTTKTAPSIYCFSNVGIQTSHWKSSGIFRVRFPFCMRWLVYIAYNDTGLPCMPRIHSGNDTGTTRYKEYSIVILAIHCSEWYDTRDPHHSIIPVNNTHTSV